MYNLPSNKLLKLYAEYASLMKAVAKKILTDDALAEDAVSDSIEKLIKNIDKVEEIQCNKTRSFIVTIVRNSAYDIQRKRKHVVFTDDTEIGGIYATAQTPPDILISTEGYRHIVDVIDGLSPLLRDVAVLSIYQGLNNSEIAEVLEIGETAVRTRLHRAKKNIKNALGGETPWKLTETKRLLMH